MRLVNHFTGNGSVWTTKYKPKNVVEIIKDCEDFDEDKYTLKYMNKYGIENVRGGTFCQEKLDKTTISFINKMLIGNTNRCYNCGDSGHFASNCFKNKTYHNNSNIFEKILKLFKCLSIKEIGCKRCGRISHETNKCYAKTNIDGDYLTPL